MSDMGVDNYVLPDVLEQGLDLVFCGMAAGRMSAEKGCYYAHPQNRFWSTLYKLRLTPRLLSPGEFRHITTFGIRLTDLAKHDSGMDKDVKVAKSDVLALREKIRVYRPRVLAFNGKTPAQKALGKPRLEFGRQEEKLHESIVFVLPSTSPANGRWNELAHHWADLADFLSPKR